MNKSSQHLSQFCREQYGLAQGSRNTLFEYCKGIKQEDLLAGNTSFGRGGSIRNLLVHIANTYEFWIGRTALKKEFEFTPYDSVNSMDEVATVFKSVDLLVYEFLARLERGDLAEVPYLIGGTGGSAAPFTIFSHVITHEFHHKGQILSMSRHLGYIPVDTDIMR
jgi:uncharacterized damage-inducible protein DinB